MTTKKTTTSKGGVKKLKLKKETIKDLEAGKNVKGGFIRLGGKVGGQVGGVVGGSSVWTGVDCDKGSCGPACTGDLRCI